MKSPVPQPLLLLAVALLLPLGACDSLECDDGGRLAAAYHDGERLAEEQNQAEYERGRLEGLSLTREDGEAEGYQTGYADGYDSGFLGSGDYEQGYAEGYDLGWDDGFSDTAACEGGADQGYADGWELGDADGYALGYEGGYTDWYRPCGVLPDARTPSESHEDESVSARDIGECHSRGLRSTRDAGAFTRGRIAGISDNADYLAGYDEQYPTGYDEGAAVGQVAAYNEGFARGYDDGADEAWAIAWSDCYDQTYPDGYEAGYVTGYEAGYEDGSYDGEYDSGC